MTSPKPIVFVGEAMGKDEAKLGAGFVGASGAELIRMLAEASVITLTAYDRDYIHRYYQTSDPELINAIWALHPEIYRTNVFQQHPPRNDLEFFCGPKAESIPGYPALLKSKYVRQDFEPELDRLADELIRQDPNLVVCLGNTALWALAGRLGITKLRGTTLLSTHTATDFKLLPTFHPAAILRQWENRPTVIADLMKAARESAYPEIRRPHREIWIEPSLEDLRTFYHTHIIGCDLLSVDIETAGNRVTCIGFAPSPRLAIVVPFDDDRKPGGNYWPDRSTEKQAWGIIRTILRRADIKKLFQNGAYDIAFLWRSMGLATYGAAEDTMLLSHAEQPEALKGLGYLGSIFSDEGAWKHMRKKHETIKRDD